MPTRQTADHEPTKPGDDTGITLSPYTVVALFPLVVAGYATAMGMATLLATGASEPTLAVMGVGFLTVAIAMAAIGRGGFKHV